VAIDHCPITVEQLHRAPAVARALSAPIGHGRKPLDVAFTATEAAQTAPTVNFDALNPAGAAPPGGSAHATTPGSAPPAR